jgi:hypothetical protein
MMDRVITPPISSVIVGSAPILFQEIEYQSQYFFGCAVIRINVEISVLPSVFQAAQLFQIFFVCPVQASTARCYGVRGTHVDQDIGMRNALPHVFDVGMFLGDVARRDAMPRQAGLQGRFSGSARPNEADDHFTLINVHGPMPFKVIQDANRILPVG